jgi:hypothetical protein
MICAEEFGQRGMLTPHTDGWTISWPPTLLLMLTYLLSFECCQHQFTSGKGLEIGWAQTFPSLSMSVSPCYLHWGGKLTTASSSKSQYMVLKQFRSSVYVVTVASLVFGLLLSYGTHYVPICNPVLTLHVNVAGCYQSAVLLLFIAL